MHFSELLTLRAGREARRELAENGLDPRRVGAMAGAAGGPKWLILSALDRYLFGDWLHRAGATQPIELVGASVGAWRFAAACDRDDPVAAIGRLEQAYLEQRYGSDAGRDEITATVGGILDATLEESTRAGILEHPRFRLQAITTRVRYPVASDRQLLQGAGLAAAALGNAVSRRRLAHLFERVVFGHREAAARFADDDLGQRRVAFTRDNLRDGVFAAGNLPLIMHPVRDPADAPRGCYRDGGLVDYHIDHPLTAPDAEAPLVLMPHFADTLLPGWFDKRLGRSARHASRTLLIGPGPGLRAHLHRARVPSRKDFYRYPNRDEARIAVWQQGIDAGALVRDAFVEMCESPDLARYLAPL